MSAQFRAAFLRAILGAVFTFGVTYFTTMAAGDDDCGVDKPRSEWTAECRGNKTENEKASYAAAAAALTYLLARGGLEGGYDTKRQMDGNRKPGDVTSTAA